jgi:Ca2+/H+ antiporter, TMEM165/GDT1 family
MTALWTSFLVVALAEMGDKTQLVALALAARYRRPWTVMLGILLATTANHVLAATVGVWVSRLLPSTALAWVLAISFLAFGVWTLIPDRSPEAAAAARWGPLLTTTVVFFLAEMGDKTQLATVALAARYPGRLVAVVAGTTAGMLAANVPAVLVGEALAGRLPLARIRLFASALFVAMGIATLVGGIG